MLIGGLLVRDFQGSARFLHMDVVAGAAPGIERRIKQRCPVSFRESGDALLVTSQV
jgi:hypothetical protein